MSVFTLPVYNHVDIFNTSSLTKHILSLTLREHAQDVSIHAQPVYTRHVAQLPPRGPSTNPTVSLVGMSGQLKTCNVLNPTEDVCIGTSTCLQSC